MIEQGLRAGKIGSGGRRVFHPSPAWLGAFALLPLLLLLLALLSFPSDRNVIFNPRLALPVLNTVFLLSASLVMAFLAAQGIIKTGETQLAWLGAGMFTFGLTSSLSAWMVAPLGANAAVTVNNLGVIVAGVLHTTGAVMSLRGASPAGVAPWRHLVVTYAAGLALLMALLTFRDQLPVFFIPGEGRTIIGIVGLAAGSLLFAASAIILLLLYFRRRSSLLYWYALGLVLVAIGLATTGLSRQIGDLIAWHGRLAMYLGSAYFVIGVVSFVRQARSGRLGLEGLAAELFPRSAVSYRLLVDSAGDAIIALTEEGKVLLWNPAAERIFGHGRAEAEGAFLDDLLGPGIADHIARLIYEREMFLSPAAATELTLKRKYGQEITVEISVSSRATRSGKITAVVARDITERKHMEAAARRSEEFIRKIAQTAPYLLFVNDLQTGSNIYIGPRVREILGYTESQVRQMGASFLETLVHPDDIDALRHGMTRLLESKEGEIIEQEYRLRRSDGRWAWVLSRDTVFLRDGNGRPLQSLGAALDITGRNEAEAQVRYQSMLVKATTDAIISTEMSPQGQFLVRTWNKAAETIYGWRADEVIGKVAIDALQAELPQDLTREEARRQFFEKGFWSGELVARRKDGRQIIVVTSQTALRDSQGRITGIVGIHHDVTELRQAQTAAEESQKRLQHLIQCNIIGVALGDLEGNVIDANDAFLHITGHDHADLAAGRINWRSITPQEYRAADEVARRKVRDSGYCSLYEKEYITKDGRRVPVLVASCRWQDAGSRDLVGGFVVDITEQKMAEKLKDDFISMVSHEIKTPLTIVMGAVYTLMTVGLSQHESEQLLKDAASGAEALSAMVENLLDLSRLQANRLTLRLEEVRLQQVARSVVEKLKNRSAIHRLKTNIPPRLGPVSADRFRVERILHNLIDNAIKFSPQGGEIIISARRRGASVVVSVSDQGVGMTQEQQSHLFGSFYKPAFESTKIVPGIGLGLALCHRLVEAHGGRIWVESRPGQGSTFSFTLPVFNGRNGDGPCDC
ncbi:MAG: PAS domain S-box protein [Chloroflexi bacterium]|nr:PAS domain S-box protein [Chloroflexota bacterium]